MVTIPSGSGNLVDILISSPVISADSTYVVVLKLDLIRPNTLPNILSYRMHHLVGSGAGVSAARFDEFGIDPNMDPELALVRAVSANINHQPQSRHQSHHVPLFSSILSFVIVNVVSRCCQALRVSMEEERQRQQRNAQPTAPTETPAPSTRSFVSIILDCL
jgi:hypothetical protein